jgi:hypothetical protein
MFLSSCSFSSSIPKIKFFPYKEVPGSRGWHRPAKIRQGLSPAAREKWGEMMRGPRRTSRWSGRSSRWSEEARRRAQWAGGGGRPSRWRSDEGGAPPRGRWASVGCEEGRWGGYGDNAQAEKAVDNELELAGVAEQGGGGFAREELVLGLYRH